MEKVYRYSHQGLRLIIALAIGVLLILLGIMMLRAGTNSEALPDRLLGTALGLLLLLASLWLLAGKWLRYVGFIKVVTDEGGLTIQNAFSNHSIKWEEITEFGTYIRRAGNVFVRIYYLKANKYRDREIVVCSRWIEDIGGLIDTIFQKALNARFLRIENTAIIPFTKKLQISRWERAEGPVDWA